MRITKKPESSERTLPGRLVRHTDQRHGALRTRPRSRQSRLFRCSNNSVLFQIEKVVREKILFYQRKKQVGLLTLKLENEKLKLDVIVPLSAIF